MAVINQPVLFPASNEVTRYLPNLLILGTNTSVVTNTIYLLPIFVKKYAINPTFCIDVSAYAVTVGTPSVTVGIYDGVDIFGSAALLFSTIFNLTSSGVKKNASNLKLKPGWYTLATLQTVAPTSGTITYRSVSQNYSMPIFKSRPNQAFYPGLFGGYLITSSASLPSNLSGQNISRTTSSSLLAALEY
jgi:hypothetical protein